MKKTFLSLLTLAFAGLGTAQAQVIIPQEEDAETIYVQETTYAPEEIDLTEGMAQNIDSLLMEWAARQYLTPDSSCIVPNVNPDFTDEEYMERLRRMPVLIEMPYNDVVRKYIDRYMGSMRRMVSYLLGAGNFYMPVFEEALDSYGLPLELKYLPIIESALKPTVKSSAGAVGLWQMISSTARQYGLEYNSLIDERRDTYKASYAAAHFLSDLFKIYGNWPLAIAAYNCGPGTVNKAIHRAGGVKDYWTIYPYLPKETRGYVPAFIAATYAMNYYCEHNVCPMVTSYPLTTDTVMVSRNVHMDQISAVCGVDKATIKALNPQYLTDIVPGDVHACSICLPSDKIMTFIDQEESVYAYRADELLTRRYVVTPATASTTYMRPTTTTRNSNQSASSRSKNSTSQSKKKDSRSKKNDSQSKKSKKKGANNTVSVKSGDSLYRIAQKNGTTVEKLKKLNKIKGTTLQPGQKLRVK